MNYADWAEWYDVFYSTAPTDDVDFYMALASESGGPVLEIGVGTGRIALPMALAGLEVVGVDLNQPMLDVAHRKALAAAPLPGSLRLIRADMRRLELGRRFPLVTIPSRTLLLATTYSEQSDTLCCAARCLEPGGRLAFNVFAPDSEMLADRSKEPFEIGRTVNPATGRHCILYAINRFDTQSQLNRGTQIVEELDETGRVARRVELEVLVRYLYPDEVMVMAEKNGLRVVEVYGDFDLSPLTEESDEMIFICEPARPT